MRGVSDTDREALQLALIEALQTQRRGDQTFVGSAFKLKRGREKTHLIRVEGDLDVGALADALLVALSKR